MVDVLGLAPAFALGARRGGRRRRIADGAAATVAASAAAALRRPLLGTACGNPANRQLAKWQQQQNRLDEWSIASNKSSLRNGPR